VEFEDSGRLPAVVERLVTFSNAKTGYTKVVAKLTACKHLSGETGGQKFSGTVGSASFPRFGDDSAAFEANFTVQGELLGEDLVIVRKGNIVMGIDEGNFPPVDVNQFQALVNKAVAKLP